jgi:hypothetical protein
MGSSRAARTGLEPHVQLPVCFLPEPVQEINLKRCENSMLPGFFLLKGWQRFKCMASLYGRDFEKGPDFYCGRDFVQDCFFLA